MGFELSISTMESFSEVYAKPFNITIPVVLIVQTIAWINRFVINGESFLGRAIIFILQCSSLMLLLKILNTSVGKVLQMEKPIPRLSELMLPGTGVDSLSERATGNVAISYDVADEKPLVSGIKSIGKTLFCTSQKELQESMDIAF
jgi:hypothetical protein